jgi:hypothetical protein
MLLKEHLMPTFKVAHLREQDQDMVVVPLSASFDHESENNQHALINEIQAAAFSAGLAGKVIPVWSALSGQTKFIAPPNWHPFFRGVSYDWVLGQVNKTISW